MVARDSRHLHCEYTPFVLLHFVRTAPIALLLGAKALAVLTFHNKMYREPTKRKARNLLLRNAVNALTKDRASTRIIDEERTREIALDAADHFEKFAENVTAGLARNATLERFNRWQPLIKSYHQTKRPSELRVLYLCGPSPENDLDVFMDCGILPENIWAIESKYSNFLAALDKTKEMRLGIKLYRGELAQFFRQVPAIFDIVYLDVCGRFMGGKPNTLAPLLEAVTFQRLAPLSALVTNYAEVKQDAIDQYAVLTSAYFMARERSVPSVLFETTLEPAELAYDGEPLRRFCAENIEPFYSDFITRFTVDIARYIIPNCRALSINSVFRSLIGVSASQLRTILDSIFRPKSKNIPAAEFDEWLTEALRRHTWEISPSSYPLYVFLEESKTMSGSDPVTPIFRSYEVNGKRVSDLLPTSLVVESILEGHWDVASDMLLSAIENSWFGSKLDPYCDAALPNLLVNSVLGIYGYPHHVAPGSSLRLKYTARETKMFADCLLFDQCREFYDFLPVLDLVPNFCADVGNEMLVRAMLDQLGWQDWSCDQHPFQGSALFGVGERHYEVPKDFAERILVT